jgi:hypothetical protein
MHWEYCGNRTERGYLKMEENSDSRKLFSYLATLKV